MDSQAQERTGAGHHPKQDYSIGGQPCLRPATLRDRGAGHGERPVSQFAGHQRTVRAPDQGFARGI